MTSTNERTQPEILRRHLQYFLPSIPYVQVHLVRSKSAASGTFALVTILYGFLFTLLVVPLEAFRIQSPACLRDRLPIGDIHPSSYAQQHVADTLIIHSREEGHPCTTGHLQLTERSYTRRLPHICPSAHQFSSRL